MWNEILTLVIRVVIAVLSVVVTYKVIPWLKQRQLYDLVRKGVEAAEKIGGTGKEKFAIVVEFLDNIGIKVGEDTKILIEAAVQELDIALGKIKDNEQDGE